MFDDLIAAASTKWNVPASWISSVISVESNWNPGAFNASDPGGSRGLMQISGPTAAAYGVTDPNALFDPATNIDVGTHLLSDLRQRYGDDFKSVYSAYNSGSPTLWQTSAQVSDHVAKALTALASYVEQNPDTSGGLAILAGILVYVLIMLRKKK